MLNNTDGLVGVAARYSYIITSNWDEYMHQLGSIGPESSNRYLRVSSR